MGRFVIGIGTHAGSVWLARILTSMEHDVLFENERLAKWVKRRDWSRILERLLDKGLEEDEVFGPYFENVRTRVEQRSIYGDFNSWAPPYVPKVAEIVPVWWVLGLVRNGIQQLFSLTNSYIWSRVTDEHYLVAGHLRNLWEVAGKRGKPWEKRTLWEKKCEMWASTPYLFDWLARQGFNVHVYRLEDLATNTDALMGLICTFADRGDLSYREIKAVQAMDVNRKIWIDRTPARLWEKWTREQQEAFNEICGDGMCRYGYEVLEVEHDV